MNKPLSFVSVILIISLAIILLVRPVHSQSCPGLPSITDSRDSQVYPTVQVGTQCWLQRNMNYKTDNSWCYNNDPQNCEIYGRLYDWYAALEACPLGWHLPGDQEWTILTTFLGEEVDAGGRMKEAGTAHWRSSNTGEDDTCSFSALPGGYRLSNDISCNLSEYAYFWSSTKKSFTQAWIRNLSYTNDEVIRYYNNKSSGFSVRCLKDE